jgi:hypothetical protein
MEESDVDLSLNTTKTAAFKCKYLIRLETLLHNKRTERESEFKYLGNIVSPERMEGLENERKTILYLSILLHFYNTIHMKSLRKIFYIKSL